MFMRIILLFCSFLGASVAAQSGAILSRCGQTIANNQHFPARPELALGLELGYLSQSKMATDSMNWRYWYPRCRLWQTAHVQTLGNKRVLGWAFGYLPTMEIVMGKSGASWGGSWAMGWGAAYISKRYDYWANPENVVIGRHLNICATAQLKGWRRLWRGLYLFGEVGVLHYSNGGTAVQNLGANIPYMGLGLRCVSMSEFGERPAHRKQALLRVWRPYMQAGIGFGAKGTGGPLFPLYGLALGASRALSRVSMLTISAEYVYSDLTAEYYRQSGQKGQHNRVALMVQHEFLFGHWAFATQGGIYLGRHAEQRSIFASKVGFVYYLRNTFGTHRHQCWLGAYVRAYFGEAEAVELQIGYRF